MPLTDGYFSLDKDVNKAKGGESSEGVLGELISELTLDMDDKELIKLKKQWTSNWEKLETELFKKQEENENYWLGRHFNNGEKRPIVDNLIFESFETFLPIATRPKAEPVVDVDDTPKGQALANNVRRMISKKADDLAFNLKLKSVTRYWGLYFVGIMKMGWSMADDDLSCSAIRPQKLILDPDGIIEDCEYRGEYIGEKRQDTASDLIKRFPKKKVFITDKVKEKLGTKVNYVEWWHDEYVFWTLDDEVLDKSKNPHWNYDSEEMTEPVDEMGNYLDPVVNVMEGKNHFKSSKKPYVFLSIFNLGKHPVDDTNLIQQNLPLQDLVNKRLKQIDYNADSSNNGLVVSGDFFTQAEASKINEALRRGGTVYVPTGDVNKAVMRNPAPNLAGFVYESLLDYRNELRNIFGTRGSTPQGTVNEKTVGGKQIIKSQDTDRIGGGISTFLEQFSDKCFNWFVQLMYVYYDEPRTAMVLGKERASEQISLSKNDFIADVTVSVKEGSMIPTDPMSKRDEAVELWSAGGIDPITFFDRLEFPNPRESAKQLYLWMADPIQLFPDLVAKQQQELAAQAMAGVPMEQAPPVEVSNLNEIPIT